MNYARPNNAKEASALLAGDPGAMVLAGGTDVLVKLQSGLIEPSLLVDIKALPGVRDITRTKRGWQIGAAVTGAEMGEHAELAAAWPGVVEAVELIGSTQVQGRATAIGNLCNASPAADGACALVAAGALVTIEGPEGSREVAAEEIPTGPGRTSLKPGEFVSSFLLPDTAAERRGDAYLRFIPRTEMDIAVVGCGIRLGLDKGGTITEARVALGAVGPRVIVAGDAAKLLIGTKLEDDVLARFGGACSAAATPIDDKRGTTEFRIEVTGVLARRAARIAYDRARGQS